MATLTQTGQIPGLVVHCVMVDVVNGHTISVFWVMFMVAGLASVVVGGFDAVGYFWPVDSIDFFHDL